MRFGTQFGSGAQPQLEQAVADGLIGRMRITFGTDPNGPYGMSPYYEQYVDWCLNKKVIPHIILMDEIVDFSVYSNTLKTMLRWMVKKGVSEASFGVGNEADSQQGNWDCEHSDNDCCFNSYIVRYKLCADLVSRASHMYQVKYTIGAGAGVTGLTFGCRVANWCRSEGVKIDFIDGHFGGWAKPDAVKREVLMARAFGLPVWCTEMGYGSTPEESGSPEAVRWVKDMLQCGFDEVFWLIHTNVEGQGIWDQNGTVRPVGEVLLGYQGAVV